MSGCTYCGDTGYSSIGAMCRCPLGVALRLQSNYGVLADRPHADAHDDRAEAITGPDDDLTPTCCAERLRAAGYHEPVIPKPQHTCRAGCGALVSACGAQCVSCATKEAKAKLEFKREDWRITWACVVGLVVGIACTLLIVWGFK